MDEQLVRTAANRAVDADRLLPGEDRDLHSAQRVDAEHWLGVYSELIAFKVDIRQRSEAALKTIHEAARAEVQNDVVVLLAEETRLVRRYEFWKRRLEELSRGREDEPPEGEEAPASRV